MTNTLTPPQCRIPRTDEHPQECQHVKRQMRHTNTSAMPMAGQVTNMPPMLGANMRPANFFITMADVGLFFCIVYFIVDNILYISFLYESDGNNEGMWRECGRKKVRFKPDSYPVAIWPPSPMSRVVVYYVVSINYVTFQSNPHIQSIFRNSPIKFGGWLVQ